MNNLEIRALINLLDDPDELIYDQVKGKLIEIGKDAIPFLENAWIDKDLGNDFQKRIENIVHNIHLNFSYDNLLNWSSNGATSLLEGLIIISQLQYPELDKEPIYNFFEKLEKEIWLELHEELTALEKIKIVNHFLFEVYSFKGDTKNYHSAYNSYINEVINSQKGNPISLACIYIIVCQRLSIPVVGINLPKHFVVAYLNEFSENSDKPLFYVNPFSKGIAFGEKDIIDFLSHLKLENKKEYYSISSNKDILKRVITNLIYSYEIQGTQNKVMDFKKLFDAIR